jgi:hypothetical protein
MYSRWCLWFNYPTESFAARWIENNFCGIRYLVFISILLPIPSRSLSLNVDENATREQTGVCFPAVTVFGLKNTVHRRWVYDRDFEKMPNNCVETLITARICTILTYTHVNYAHFNRYLYRVSKILIWMRYTVLFTFRYPICPTRACICVQVGDDVTTTTTTTTTTTVI